VEKAIISKGYENPKRKLGITMHFFLERIELKFRKKMPYILCVLKVLLEWWLPNYLSKMRCYPYFSFWICFSPIVLTFAKTPLY